MNTQLEREISEASAKGKIHYTQVGYDGLPLCLRHLEDQLVDLNAEAFGVYRVMETPEGRFVLALKGRRGTEYSMAEGPAHFIVFQISALSLALKTQKYMAAAAAQ